MGNNDDSQRRWRKSALCSTSGCVEVAEERGQYLLRDSKDPEGPVLTFTRAEWDAFVAGVRSGDFEFN